MAKTVSEVLLDVLAEAGVRFMYGIPGDAINSLVEAVRKQDTIKFIQVRHEESGAFAASAQAKLTGTLTVCVGTAGPGAIHLLNGLYDAKLDRASVLAITGQVATRNIGTDYHQEVDLYTLFKDVSVFNETVVSAGQMPRLAVHACQAAISQRGVAHLSLPVDIAGAAAPSHGRHAVFTGTAMVTPCAEDLDRAAVILNKADRVVILAGFGALGARDELVDLAEALGAPVIKALRGKELLPDHHPLSLGGLGLLGTRPAVDAVSDADALLMIGTDFPYPDFYPDGIPGVQIDDRTDRLGKRYPVEVGLRGDARLAVAALLPRIVKKSDRKFLKDSQEAMRAWWTMMERAETSESEPIRPQVVARAVGDLSDDNAIFVCDTGAVTVWGARHIHIREGQRFTLSSSLASMAYALPGAIGAQLAYPDHQVIALAGDGGFTMLVGDLVTAVKYELPIKIIVFNNGKLGLIQMEQEVQGYPEFQTHLHNPDFRALAESCGATGFSVRSTDGLIDVLESAFAAPGPVVVDVHVNPNEQTMPPRITAKQAFGYGVAKAREFFGAGDSEGGLKTITDALS